MIDRRLSPEDDQFRRQYYGSGRHTLMIIRFDSRNDTIPHLMVQSATARLFEEVNISGTKNLLKCIYEHRGVRMLIYTSSTGIIHNGYTDILNATEDVPIFPNHPEYYGLNARSGTKEEAEVIFRKANRKHGLLTCILRCPTLYGEADNTTIPQIVGNAQAGRGNMQIGDGENMFDYLYLGNAAYAHRLAANKLLRLMWRHHHLPRMEGSMVGSLSSQTKFWDFVKAVGTAAGCGVIRENVKVVPTWLYYAMAVIAKWSV
ncbi:NAD(P)-binding protein [Karstenula rhodostoma CBS 690.94]|uniref:NAD(P)-binding protein n=1 Tax=Karstenula rhodostoma CBS 690.94 TaxID=1392251 RepID=A0A9P4PMA5_9PLEO|nr:NAD(P)-binding protein [Karstenula rhodostoma CBS 690.94]